MNKRPNILLITTHDLGTHLGCYGFDPAIPSPHLDRLAAEGVRFENHFCTAPFCSPSRGSIITGRYPHANGLMGLVNLGWDIPGENKLLPAQLGEAGYQTALIGLQHVTRDPSRLGYEDVVNCGNRCRTVAPVAAERLRELARGAERPFFLEVGFFEVHRSYGDLEQLPVREEDVRPLPFLKDTPGLRADLAAFCENIRRMDESVGEVLAALESSGLAESTLVVFTTDHGIAFPRAKATLYDPGIRTTLLMRWPGGLPRGRAEPALASNVDLYATLMELAGRPLPEECDGQSLLPLLRGKAGGRESIFAEKNTDPGDIKRCLRTRTHKYVRNYSAGPLLSLPVDIEVSATRRDMGDDHLSPRPEVELYDLNTDPLETENLAGREGHRPVEEEMAAALGRLLEDTRDPILAGPVPRPEEEPGIRERNRSADSMRVRFEREARIADSLRQLREQADEGGNG
jgi:arylsulfatase A-like enzyme